MPSTTANNLTVEDVEYQQLDWCAKNEKKIIHKEDQKLKKAVKK